MSNSLPQGWEEVLLKDYLESIIDYRGKTPKKSDSGIVTLSAKSVRMGYIQYDNAYYISEETYNKFMTRGFPKKGDVLITTEAPLGCISRLDRDKVGLAQRLITVRGKENKLDNGYLLYYLQSSLGQHELTSRASGTTVQGIKRTEFEKVKLILPPLNEQKRIADILSAFDDKIELNNQMNQTLESMSSALFKEWFENFNFPNEQGKAYKENGGEFKSSELGEIPVDWEVKCLKDISKTISKGTTPRKKDVDGLETQILFLKVKDINDNGIIKFSGLEKIPKEVHLKQLKRSILEVDDILISIAGTIGRVTITPRELDNANCNQAIAFIRLKDKEKYKKYVYQWIRTSLVQSQINSSIVQGVQANVSLTTLGELNITMPDEKTIEKFNDNFSPIFEQIQQNQQQNQTLKKQRDTFLPKLMSGEIRV